MKFIWPLMVNLGPSIKAVLFSSDQRATHGVQLVFLFGAVYP